MQIVKRQTLTDLVLARNENIRLFEQIKTAEAKINSSLDEQLGRTVPFIFKFQNYHYNKPDTAYFDAMYWIKVIQLFHIERFMLCTEYQKIKNKIYDDYDFLPFTAENVDLFLSSCADWIKDGVNEMLKRVYDSLVNGHYYTGKEKKKRNNNGLDESFILWTYDYSRVVFYHDKPTITDDLEKLCYLMDGKEISDYGIIQTIKKSKLFIAENAYFSIKVCKNGNTHYKFKNDWHKKLNAIMADRSAIGQHCKIKVI